MKSFKQFIKDTEISKFEWFTFEVEEFVVHILYESSENEILQEAKYRGTPLGGQYSAELHRVNSTIGKDHLHVYAKNNQIFAMNIDGSAHDRSHGTKIPNKVAASIQHKFSQFTIPQNNFIESAPEELIKLFSEYLLLG